MITLELTNFTARFNITPRTLVASCILPTPNTTITEGERIAVSNYGIGGLLPKGSSIRKGDDSRGVVIQPCTSKNSSQCAVKIRYGCDSFNDAKIELTAQRKMEGSHLTKYLVPSNVFVSQTTDGKPVDIRIQSEFIKGTMTIDQSPCDVKISETLKFNIDFLRSLLIDKVTIEPGLSFRTDNIFYKFLMQIFCVSPFFSQNVLYSHEDNKFYIVDPGHDMNVEDWDKQSVLGPDLWKAKVIAMNMLGLGICASLAVYGKIANGKIK